jgi:hypothetical protein
VGVKVTGDPVQTELDVGAIVTAGVTELTIFMVIELEVAVGTEAQGSVEVITQETTSPLARELLVKTDPVEAFTPFSFH